MRIKLLLILLLITGILPLYAQEVKFIEFDLENGLHVILHQDKTVPVVAVSVMYHVGSKDEDPQRTGFAHFFEHLLFEGSDNMQRGDFMKIVSSNGGQNNANTTQDRTFYYEVFPSNQLELGLWLESERMLHPRIDEAGVKTQNEVVKEEKRLRIDNKPYANAIGSIFGELFRGHPYRWQPIGSTAHLDAAKLGEFIGFFKKYYIPNNAVLTIAGDLDIEATKKMVADYFSEVPRGAVPERRTYALEAMNGPVSDTLYDPNIRVPAIFTAYRVPGLKSRDSKIFGMISAILSGGNSARLNVKMVDRKKNAMQVAAFNYPLEDHGAFITLALPNNNTPLDELQADIDEEVLRLQREPIGENELKKLQNQFENDFVSANVKMIGVAENLANGYVFHDKHSGYLNEQLEQIRSITPEEIRDAARKYLITEHRVKLYYLPKK